MLTPEQQAAANQIDAELDGATSQTLITVDDQSATYRAILLPIVMTLSAIACPNWEITQDEHLQLVEAFIPLLKKYMPNIEEGTTIPPEVIALLAVAMIAAPRLIAQKPMRDVTPKKAANDAKEVKEAA